MPESTRVLVVDDDFRVADIHSAYVSQLADFIVVGSAQTAAAAVDMNTKLEPDLILLDIYLPDEHGVVLLETLRKNRRVDIFVLTAAREVAIVKRCFDLGALHYLIKPFTKDELKSRLQEYRSWHQTVQLDGELDQPSVDRIFGGLGRSPLGLPKGLSAETMALVEAAMASSDEPLSSDDVAQLTGISRVSVRRYLRHLADIGQAVVVQDYGTPGRPRHRFQLT